MIEFVFLDLLFSQHNGDRSFLCVAWERIVQEVTQSISRL